jgi:hypothetical protein
MAVAAFLLAEHTRSFKAGRRARGSRSPGIQAELLDHFTLA